MRTKRLLALCLLLALLTGCGGQTTTETTADTLPAETEPAETETAEVSYDPMLDAVDLGGMEYQLLSRKVEGSYCYPYHEFLVDEERGNVVVEAVYNRNLFMEEKYNMLLVAEEASWVTNVAKPAILAGGDTFDLIFPMHSEAYTMALEGLFNNCADLSHVDTTKPYWRTSLMESTSVAGKNYFLTGDLNLASLNGVGVVFFNKGVAAKQNITDLYETVLAGNWTIDTFTEYCRGITADLNGDGVFNGDDMFGLTCNGFVWQPLYGGTGSAIIPKDENDIPSFAWGSEHNVNIINKLIGFLNDKESVILVNQYPELEEAGGWGPASIRMFSEDRALFWIEIIYGIHELRTMETDFGILPMPKYDSAQADYASYVHSGWTSTTAVPATTVDMELAGRLIEDMAYQSSVTIRPAYYDATLKGKISRDEESGKMLDIIYSNIRLDPVLLMANVLPVDSNMREFVIKNETAVVSKIAALTDKCETAIAQHVETFMGIDH